MSTPTAMCAAFVDHVRTVADLHDQRIEVDDRVERLERPPLPSQDFLTDLVGDLADRLVREFGPDRPREVMLDVTDRHPTRVEADDHLVEPTQSA